MHYQLIEAPLGYSPWPATPTAVPPNSPWGTLGSNISGWIAPVAAPGWDSSSCPVGVYHYRTTFVLPQFVDPASATIYGRWTADNDAQLFFNGAARGAISSSSHDGWSSWHNFSFAEPKTAGPGSFLAYPGVNVLDFFVTNVNASATGLRVELSGFSGCGVCDPPVIEFITGSQALPFNMFAKMEVKVSGTPPMTYQWYHNNVALSEQGKNGTFTGVQSYQLRVNPANYTGSSVADAVCRNFSTCWANLANVA